VETCLLLLLLVVVVVVLVLVVFGLYLQSACQPEQQLWPD
jgi:hypothetical protein